MDAFTFGSYTAGIGVALCLLVVLIFLYYDNDPFPMPTPVWMLYFGSILSGPSLVPLGLFILITGKIP